MLVSAGGSDDQLELGLPTNRELETNHRSGLYSVFFVF